MTTRIRTFSGGCAGGGGNFGIVTSFEYRLHPVGSVLAGFLFYPIAKGTEVFRFYREYMPQSPDACRVDIGVLTAPDGNLVVGLIPCYVGPVAEGERLIEPLRRLGPVVRSGPPDDLLRVADDVGWRCCRPAGGITGSRASCPT